MIVVTKFVPQRLALEPSFLRSISVIFPCTSDKTRTLAIKGILGGNKISGCKRRNGCLRNPPEISRFANTVGGAADLRYSNYPLGIQVTGRNFPERNRQLILIK